ncbi:hypothetical protein [Helicobacter canis]|uniref:hypothetical protein n=1 Tax=Helicobacter canis TaxID=29419 RepID=UPI0011C03658|nr:hypothetical protein [Helicobacter canis]
MKHIGDRGNDNSHFFISFLLVDSALGLKSWISSPRLVDRRPSLISLRGLKNPDLITQILESCGVLKAHFSAFLSKRAKRSFFRKRAKRSFFRKRAKRSFFRKQGIPLGVSRCFFRKILPLAT